MIDFFSKLKNNIQRRIDFIYFKKRIKAPGYPLSTLLDEEKPQPFFILSAGRSGSTFLRLHLQRCSDIHIPPESDDAIIKSADHFLDPHNKEWKDKVEKGVKAFSGVQAFQYWEMNPEPVANELRKIREEERSFFRLIEEIYQKHSTIKKGRRVRYWGDKTPYLIYYLDRLKVLFPKGKFIFLIRDGRDVIASRKNRGMMKGLEEACNRWLFTSRTINDALMEIDPDRCLVIHFESLIGSQKEELDKVLDFIGSEKELDDKKTEEDGDLVLPHHEFSKGEIDPTKIGQWEKLLTSKEKEFLHSKLETELKRWGYS